MDQLQAEIDAEGSPVEIHILGVNPAGLELGNPSITNGRTLPWLQDTVIASVWATWAPVFRDVVILDGEGRKVGVYNLTAHNLSDAANYAELKALLLSSGP